MLVKCGVDIGITSCVHTGPASLAPSRPAFQAPAHMSRDERAVPAAPPASQAGCLCTLLAAQLQEGGGAVHFAGAALAALPLADIQLVVLQSMAGEGGSQCEWPWQGVQEQQKWVHTVSAAVHSNCPLLPSQHRYAPPVRPPGAARPALPRCRAQQSSRAARGRPRCRGCRRP